MQPHPVAIVGASGYSGLELTRILARHPAVRLTALLSDRWAGEKVASRLPVDGLAGGLQYSALSGADRLDAELVLLATPAEASANLAPRLLARGVRVVDVSGAFRLRDPSAYPLWYGFEHPAPALLAEAVYGLPELGRDGLRGARLVANAGCYASTVALAVAPFVRAGLVEADGIAVTALSGVSGAGRKASDDYSFVEVADDLRAYRLGKHQHVPEIEQTVARGGGRCGPISFTPVLVPIRRGILSTAHLRIRDGVGAADFGLGARVRLRQRAVREGAAGRQGDGEGRAAHQPLPRGCGAGRAGAGGGGDERPRQPGEGRGRQRHPGHERGPRAARDRGPGFPRRLTR